MLEKIRSKVKELNEIQFCEHIDEAASEVNNIKCDIQEMLDEVEVMLNNAGAVC